MTDPIDDLIETMLWAENDQGEQLDAHYAADHLAPATRQALTDAWEAFWLKARPLLTEEEAAAPDTVAYYLWLTARGHGTEFWGSGYERGEELTKLADDSGLAYAEPYVGDDGLIWLTGFERYGVDG